MNGFLAKSFAPRAAANTESDAQPRRAATRMSVHSVRSVFMRNDEVRTRVRHGLPATAAVVALIAAPATASARESYKIGFEKDCPELTCTGTLIKRSGAPIPGSLVATTLTPLWFESDMFGYSARETFSRGESTVTMNLVGTVDYSAEPDVTEVLGNVATGTWRGRPLSGALVRGSAERVTGTTFRGVLVITPRDGSHP